MKKFVLALSLAPLAALAACDDTPEQPPVDDTVVVDENADECPRSDGNPCL